MGMRDVPKFTLDIAGWVILARNEYTILHDIPKSDQRIKIGGRIRTPYSAGKMEPGAQSVFMAHPI